MFFTPVISSNISHASLLNSASRQALCFLPVASRSFKEHDHIKIFLISVQNNSTIELLLQMIVVSKKVILLVTILLCFFQQ